MGDLIFWNGKKYECNDKRVKEVHSGVGGNLDTGSKYYFVKLVLKKKGQVDFRTAIKSEKDLKLASENSHLQAEEYLKQLDKIL